MSGMFRVGSAGVKRVHNEPGLSPLRGSGLTSLSTHGLRRGLQSFAASRLGSGLGVGRSGKGRDWSAVSLAMLGLAMLAVLAGCGGGKADPKAEAPPAPKVVGAGSP